eukprot:TRINITY_DN9093_c0_g1_i6.p1 TRINITY_DN9093_c0_g1~~TRINITY_DN9093_c0_g1_i6.p1  ORF type:complete len:394 (-),score=72.05 TRINITY_DN9093_c0_g1_i6:686-1867(-)
MIEEERAAPTKPIAALGLCRNLTSKGILPLSPNSIDLSKVRSFQFQKCKVEAVVSTQSTGSPENPTMHGCCKHGPGFLTPQDAMKHGERERTLYLPCIAPGKEDYLAVVDVDESSQTYSTVVHRTYTGNTDDELHHTGWNACSSCYGDSSKSRKYLVAPALKSGNIYFFDVSSEREPTLHHVLLGSQIKEQVGLTWPHTSHCLPSGEIMISHMGNKDESSAGNFLLVDSEDFSIKGKWIPQDTKFGYDFWYQPRHNIMVSSEWGEPSKLKHHFDPSHVAEFYGHTLHFWNWNERTLLKSIELGDKGRIPLEVRFLHNPSAAIGFVGAALSSSIILIYQREDGEWNTVPVIEIPPISVDGWALPKMPALITDILVSLDDRFLYLSNWLHGMSIF